MEVSERTFETLTSTIRKNLQEFDQLLTDLKLSVNVRNPSQRTLLHCICASKSDSLTIINHLISKGADLNAIDSDNLTPIQLAGALGNSEVVEYLALLDPISMQYKISAFETLGARLGTEEAVIKYWEKALQLRLQISNEDNNKKVTNIDSFAVFGMKEITHIDEIHKTARDAIKRSQYCFLYLCKNLGLEHFLTPNESYKMLKIYRKSDSSCPSPDLIRHGLFYILESEETIFLISTNLFSMLSEWIEAFVIRHNREHNLTYRDIGKIFKLLVEQSEKLGKTLQVRQSNMQNTPFVEFLYRILLLCFSLEKTTKEKQKFNDDIKYLIQIGQKYHQCFGTSILHQSVLMTIPLGIFFKLITASTIEFVKHLLHLGINVNLLNKDNQTALQVLLRHRWYSNWRYKRRRRLPVTEMVDILLENGTDIDNCDKHGMTALHYFNSNGISNYDVKYRTLQCLAACTIKKYDIDYTKKVPKRIEAFINRH